MEQSDSEHMTTENNGVDRLSGLPQGYFEQVGIEYPDADISALRVFLAVSGAGRRIDTAVTQLLHVHGLTVTKTNILYLVAAREEGTTVARLREHLLMTQPNVTFVVGALVKAGLLRRSAVPSDKRLSIIRITAAGRRLLAKMTGGQLSALARAVSVIDPSERETFIRMLAQLTESFESLSR